MISKKNFGIALHHKYHTTNSNWYDCRICAKMVQPDLSSQESSVVDLVYTDKM